MVKYVLQTSRNAVEVTIITNDTKEIEHDIIKGLKHGATAVNCHIMYTDEERKMIVSIINYGQLNNLMKIVKKYPDTFISYGNVDGVYGNFRWNTFDPVK